MQIAPARATDAAAVKRLLEAAGLPTADIGPSALEHFLVAREGEVVLGTIGLDIVGAAALLRSLVVADGVRGRGLGCELVRAAEALAAERGVRQLYLLTTTAGAFFAARGYGTADRSQAPEAIRMTPQFSSLCPSSSIFMTRSL